MMIKKLRRRFIIVNMSILTCVLFGVLTGIFTFMYSSEVRISYELMEAILYDREGGFKEHELVLDANPIIDDFSVDCLANTNSVSLLNYQPRVYSLSNEVFQKATEEFNPNQNKNPFQNPDKNPNQNPDKPFEPKPDLPPEPTQAPSPIIPQTPTDSSSIQAPTSAVGDSDSSGDSSSAGDSSKVDTNKNSAADKPDNSQNDIPVGKNLQVPSEIGGGEDVPQRFENDSYTNQTEANISTTTISDNANSSESIITSVTTTSIPAVKSEKHDDKEFADPYRGSVKRAYIMVQFNDKNDIDRISYQYFEDVNEDEITAAVEKIIADDGDRGKLEIGNYKLRYMKKDNPKVMSGGGRLLFLDRTLEVSTINRMLFIFIIIGGVGVILIFGISVILANWTIKPVDKAWQQQKQFVADASHELKTPLTVISANTDVILSNENDIVKNQTKWLSYIKEETKRMTKLVNSMLYIAKYDSNEMKFIANPFNLSGILSSISLQFEALVFENGKILETDIQENINLKGDEDKIKQLINILLDNALKYSTENGIINISLSKDMKTGKISIVVSNSSDFISEDKIGKLFDRFYRLDDSRNRKTGGSGLGLNIAKSIVETHGATINAIHENGVTSFVVSI